MDMLVIHGGAPLVGRVAVSGAKNAALPLMAASLMADGPVLLGAVPDLIDVRALRALLGGLGVESRAGADGLRLVVTDDRPWKAPAAPLRRIRAGFCVLGPLLARRGRARVALPGGCQIGPRPIGLHLDGLRALGARIDLAGGFVEARAHRLRGARIDLAGPFGSTVTGTCNVLSAAVLARGRTVIRSAAREPEVVDLGEFLMAMGARIEGLGTSELHVEGVSALTGAAHRVIPDRIEAATLLIAGAIAGSAVQVDGARADHLAAVLGKLRAIGVRIDEGPAGIAVRPAGPLRAAHVCTRPYPGIPTDVQAPMTALLCTAAGASVVHEAVFPDRFGHLAALARLGADVRRSGQAAIIRGPVRLQGTTVSGSDLRASAALVLAGLAAGGTTRVCRADHLDRGYERLDAKLRQLGAAIERARAPGPLKTSYRSGSARWPSAGPWCTGDSGRRI